MMTLGKYIRSSRTMVGISQTRLASMCRETYPGIKGIVRNAVCYWESDQRVPSVPQLAAMGTVLGWSNVQFANALQCATRTTDGSDVV